MSLRLGNQIIAGALADTSAFATKTELAGKVDTSDLTECAVVIESKRPTAADPTWYRLYSDGWVEQGGLTPSGADQSTQTVNLIKTMENSSYFVSAIQRDGPYGNYTNGLRILNYTTTSFQINYRTGGVTVCYWEVKGFAAQ